MRKNFVRKTFDRWLSRSSARFHHPPRVVLARKDYFVLQFSGITPVIQCSIRKDGMVEIYAIYQGEGWDILTEFDVVARRTSAGQYYCGLCTSPEMFTSRAALWVTHSFEPLLAWTNEYLHTSHWLRLCRCEGTTWAELKSREDMHAGKAANHLVYACPVVRGRRSQTPGA